MRAVFLIPIIYLAALLETSLASRWEVRGIVPDLLALVAFGWLATANSRYAFLSVALVGFASDVNSSAPLGTGIAAFAIVGYLVMYLQRNLHLDGLLAQLGIVGFGTTAACLCQVVAIRISGDVQLSFLTLIERAVLVGIYTTGVAIPLLMIANWLKPRRISSPIAAPTA